MLQGFRKHTIKLRKGRYKRFSLKLRTMQALLENSTQNSQPNIILITSVGSLFVSGFMRESKKWTDWAIALLSLETPLWMT
jgi:hypothetical protein